MSIQITQLSKVYGPQKAVDDISFSVNKGEIVGFLGPNGAGKSTTMKIVTGYLNATAGTVRVNDMEVTAKSLDTRRAIGYLPEHNPLYLDMYIKESLRFVGFLYGLKGETLSKRVSDMIELVGLQVEQHKKIGQLSKGYRQRVGLAQALIHDPSVLILDEPTTGLDPNQIVEIRNVIKSVGQHKTVLFSSHIMQEIDAICDRVVIINRGRLVKDSSLKALRQEGQSLEAIFRTLTA